MIKWCFKANMRKNSTMENFTGISSIRARLTFRGVGFLKSWKKRHLRSSRNKNQFHLVKQFTICCLQTIIAEDAIKPLIKGQDGYLLTSLPLISIASKHMREIAHLFRVLKKVLRVKNREIRSTMNLIVLSIIVVWD